MSAKAALARAPASSVGTGVMAAAFLQRKCNCGAPTAAVSGECEGCRANKLQRRALTVSTPGDRYEQEADRAADAVVSGKSLATALSPVSAAGIQRDEPPKAKTDAEKYQEGLGKLGEAFLQTPIGKDILERVKQDKLVKGASDFVGTLPGIIIAGASATGAVSALAAAHQGLPAQIPEIPLDALTPGLSVQITYNGPVDKPTDASISFKFTEQAPATPGGKKPAPTAAEKFRADTARMAADQEKFRAGLKYAPGSPQDLQQQAEDQAIKAALPGVVGSSGPNVDRIISQYPGLATSAPAPGGVRLTPPTFNYGYQPPSLFGDQFKYKLPGEEKKKEDGAAVQRKASSGNAVETAPPAVDKTLRASGQTLDKGTRSDMETRFGHDFSQVRIHTDAEAAASARAVNASAYTVGRDIVFGTGQFSPGSHEGRRLLAHELAHVIQQGAAPNAGFLQCSSEPSDCETAMKEQNPEKMRDPEEVKVLCAADRARKNPKDDTRMMLSAAEIVYRLANLYLPDLAKRISGVGFSRSVEGIRVETDQDSISITAGREFVLGVTGEALAKRVTELRSAMLAKTKPSKPDNAAPAAAAAQTGNPEAAVKKPPVPDMLDQVAVPALKDIYCRTQATGLEHCGNIIRSAEGALRATGPYKGKEGICNAMDKIRQDERRVGYYHSHPAGQGLGFSQPGMNGRATGDTDEAEDNRIDYYLINSEGKMLRYAPSKDEYRNGRHVDLGASGVTCAK